jgi:hydroxypyruvate reductase
MSNLTQLRLAAREIFDETLRAVDAGDAVRRAVRLEGARLKIRDANFDLHERNIYSIAIGKAALPMALALSDILGNQIVGGIIAGNTPRHGTDRGGDRLGTTQVANLRYTVFNGGHPEPNEQSLAAAQACFDLLERANQGNALVIFLISGGGSAMIESPISEDITLADLRAANRALVSSGASIGEINAVRRVFSAVKGGRLSDRAPNCDQITLIVSDVPTGAERNVASGPTLAPPGDSPDPLEVIDRYNLRSQLPETIVREIDGERKPLNSDSTSRREHFVLLDNHDALEAAARAARRLGYFTEIARDISDQPIEEGCGQLFERLAELRARTSVDKTPGAVCLISGGEFACPVRGDGIGGRNQETALRLGSSTNFGLSDTGHFVALCAGTDGIDGNSPAAGAIVDDTTTQRAKSAGLNAEDFLKRSDAYSFFVALGDAITTGATGTNVRDVRILLANRE